MMLYRSCRWLLTSAALTLLIACGSGGGGSAASDTGSGGGSSSGGANPGCTTGQIENQVCVIGGAPGIQTRACDTLGQWGSWNSCVANADPNTCAAGDTQTTSCTIGGLAGNRTRTCGGDTLWGAWSNCVSDPIEPNPTSNTYYVSIAGPHIGNDSNPGTDEQSWRFLQNSVNKLGPGDTLIVRRGYYSGQITVSNSGTAANPIVIRAEVPFETKIEGGFVINGDYVTIYGFDIQQPLRTPAITINAVVGTEILGNKIHDSPYLGIDISPSASNFRIAGNDLTYIGQIGIAVDGSGGRIQANNITEVVAYHPVLDPVNYPSGDDADGMLLHGSGHTIGGNIIANYADPLDSHNYDLAEPIHNAHADCFDTRAFHNSVIEGNHCWSNFHVSKGIIFNGPASNRPNITIRNNIFEYRDIGLSAYEYGTLSDLYVYNNLFKSQIDDVIDSYFNPGAQAAIPGNAIHIANINDYAIFNNITLDCDNHNAPNLTDTPYDIDGGTGIVDYNFSWNSDGAAFTSATDPGPNGSLSLNPTFASYDTNVHGYNDYRLQSTSPLAGLGTASITTPGGDFVSVTDDIQGTLRPQDVSYEPGPFEYLATSSPLRQAPVSEHVNDPRLELTPTSCSAPVSPVNVEIARWRGNREGAMVIRFDDSTPGQALCGLEAFHSRGLTSTWYVNPGRSTFQNNRAMWDQAPALGQELANHTMNHSNVSGYAAWHAEVADAADVIWEIRHGLPLQQNASLVAFNTSSSTSWSWAPSVEVEILSEFNHIDRQTFMGPVYQAVGNPSYSVPQLASANAMYCSLPGYTIDANGDCVSGSTVANIGVTGALANNSVYTVAFHGILSTAVDACAAYESGFNSSGDPRDSGVGGVYYEELESFLNSVAAMTDRLWVAGRIELYKYTQEAQRSNIRMHQECNDRIYFDLATTLGPLYDEPLTLLVTVPSDWTSCTATQGAQVKPCTIGSDGRVMLDAIPNKGRIALFRQ